MKARLFAIALVSLLLSTAGAFAQQHMNLPQASPHAKATETVGVTEIAVDYHRPAVNKRLIFGGLVPWGVIWRAGANENTLISFSTPVKVEGHEVPAGTYSLFLIPGQPQFTLVLNRFTGGWGTYNYDASEDLLRTQVTSETAPMQERLVYTFDDTKDDAATLSLRWDTLRIPVKIAIDTNALVKAGIQAKLRGGLHWDPQAWAEAASWTARNGSMDDALAYVDHSIELGPNPQNLRLRARILEKKGDTAGARQLRAQADALSPTSAMINNAYTLIGAKKYDDAAKLLDTYAAANPRSWRVWNVMGDLYAAQGDKAKAQGLYDKAMSLAGDQSERTEVQDSINAMGAGSI